MKNLYPPNNVIELVSSDDEDCSLISGGGSRSKRAKNETLIPVASSHNKPTPTREVANKTKQVIQVAPIPPAAAAAVSSHNKNKNKRKKIELKSLIAVNKMIPSASFTKHVDYRRKFPKDYNMRKYLNGKKVVMYGLPGWHPYEYNDHQGMLMAHQIWHTFYVTRIVNPCKEFLKQAESLKAQGVDEIIFIAVNPNIISTGHIDIRVEEYCKFIHDKDAWFKKERSFAYKLGLLNIEDAKPLQTARRYILVVDNLKVKLANIESSDGTFTVSTTQEILKAFDQ